MRSRVMRVLVALAAGGLAGRAAPAQDVEAVSRLTLRGYQLEAGLADAVVLDTNTVAVHTPAEQKLEAAALALLESDTAQASIALREATRLDADSRTVRFMAASVFIQGGHFKEARDVLEDLLRQHPQDYSLMNNLAWLYATAGDRAIRNPARAVQLAREALLVAPHDYHVWSTLGEAHYVNQEYERATRAIREALRIAQEQQAPSGQRADYEKQLARYERAARAFSLVD